MTAAKARDDEPFDFNLDAVQVEKDVRPFRFHYGGKRWTMAHRETIDNIPLLEAAERNEAEATLASFRVAMGAEQWAEFRKLGLRGKQTTELMRAYDRFCGGDLGESQGSTGS